MVLIVRFCYNGCNKINISEKLLCFFLNIWMNSLEQKQNENFSYWFNCCYFSYLVSDMVYSPPSSDFYLIWRFVLPKHNNAFIFFWDSVFNTNHSSFRPFYAVDSGYLIIPLLLRKVFLFVKRSSTADESRGPCKSLLQLQEQATLIKH